MVKRLPGATAMATSLSPAPSIRQRVSEPERFFVCGTACSHPWLRSITRPLGMIPLPLGDGRSPDGRYRYGDITVATAPGSPELLADRVRLLAIRDALDGRRTLNWDHGTAMTAWTGVTVGGTPPRVTKLQLSDGGLSGEISGLLGNLTGLDELRLDGNTLAGAIPSKLSQLANLRDAYLGGNQFSVGCVPPSLRTVANNDIISLGFPDCLPPLDITYGEHILTDGSYLYADRPGDQPLIFDVPAGIRMTIGGFVISAPLSGYPPSGPGLILEHVDGHSWTGFDLLSAMEWNRWVEPGADRIAVLFDRIIEPAWLGAPETPSSGLPTLTAVGGGGAGEILLEWAIARAGATRWQYRQWGRAIPRGESGPTSPAAMRVPRAID